MSSLSAKYAPAGLADELTDAGLFCQLAHIGGEPTSAISGETIPVTDPATGETIGTIPSLSPDQSRAAIDAAQHAFPAWSSLLPQERSAILRRWYDLIMDAREDLARIMVAEQGKPISEARGEIAEVEIWREPAGVAALITPWNFPSAMITRKAAAALAAGCTCLVHPSSETPFSATALAVLAARAGILAGAFNVITGKAATIVEPWTVDPRVRVLSFTGSTEIGKLLYRQSADTVKRLVMELGGHAPFIVFADADLDQAVEEAIKAKFATSGQDCLGANRFFIDRRIYETFCARFAEAAGALSIGLGMTDPDIGPLMNEKAVAKQVSHVEDALAKGARCLAGGKTDPQGPLFFQPTVLADVPADALIMNEETFGPVAALTPFDSEEEAIARANATEYGLIAYLHTMDPRRIYRASRQLQFGMVAVNRTKVTGAPIPFGGFKQSGLGREGARLGMEEFTEVKYVCRDWA
jgi:aspartate-semialdehyde dehydrogenase